MGLDTVDIVTEAEERFRVSLSDAALAQVRTVADLAAAVIAAAPRSTGPCPTASMFYRFRRLVMEHGSAARGAVRPSTRLADLLPRRARSVYRRMLRAEPRLPAMRTPAGVDAALVWFSGLSLFAGLFTVAVIAAKIGLGAAGASAIGLLAAVIAVNMLAVRLLATPCSPGMETVGALVRAAAPLSPHHGGLGRRLLEQQAVLEGVREIVSRTLGIPIERVRAESDFVKDLGAD